MMSILICSVSLQVRMAKRSVTEKRVARVVRQERYRHVRLINAYGEEVFDGRIPNFDYHSIERTGVRLELTDTIIPKLRAVE